MSIPGKKPPVLARMPRETAATRLTALIVALPDELSKDIPAKTIAAGLVALLPKANGFDVRSQGSVFATGEPQRAQIRFALGALAIMVMIALALSASLRRRQETAPSVGRSAGDSTTLRRASGIPNVPRVVTMRLPRQRFALRNANARQSPADVILERTPGARSIDRPLH